MGSLTVLSVARSSLLPRLTQAKVTAQPSEKLPKKRRKACRLEQYDRPVRLLLRGCQPLGSALKKEAQRDGSEKLKS